MNSQPPTNLNPRTNPFGKFVTGFFNFRTELHPLRRLPVRTSAVLTALSVWGGLFFGGYYILETSSEQTRWNNERSFKAHQTDVTGANYRLNYPAEAQPHHQPLVPFHNHLTVRPEMVFGNNNLWGPNWRSYTHVNTMMRNNEDKADSIIFQGGHNWNSQRYTKAKSADEYDAIRLRALFNLAAAAYHEGRRPGAFIPLATQMKIAQVKQESISGPL